MPVVAMTCTSKQAHEKTDKLFIYAFEAPGHEARTIVANLTNVYEVGEVAGIALPGTQTPEVEIVPRAVFGVHSDGMAMGRTDAAPGTDVTEAFGCDAPVRRFRLVFEIEGEAHYAERLEAELRKALGKGEGRLADAVVVGPA